MRLIQNSESGFTLLELIIVFAIISIMSTLGIAAFVDYNRSQTLNSATLDLANILQLAKSRAQSQVKPDNKCTGTLSGYKVGICRWGNPSVLTGDCSANDSSKSYALYPVCDGPLISVADKTLPSSISFDSSTNTTAILFRVLTGGVALTGGVNGLGTIVLSGSGKTKTITIDSSGNIDSN